MQTLTLKDDLTTEIGTIFRSIWTVRDGQVVPSPEVVKLKNDAVKLTGTVLYADLSESTAMVQSKTKEFSAEVYKAFLHCAAKIVKDCSGSITAYDGDRIMAVFLGDSKNTNAVKAALKINWACIYIIQPEINKQYNTDFVLKHTVGVDTSELFIARTGVRGDNDLVWVGRAANWAAKLSDMPDSHPTWITKEIYDGMNNIVKYADGKDMWEARIWNEMGSSVIYRSKYWWSL